MLKKIDETVSRELVRYPRGSRRSAQNLFRAIYQMVRAASLGRKEPWSGSAAECAAWAAAIVRRHHPGFTPQTI